MSLIACNYGPLRARLTTRAEDWRWSSAAAHLAGKDDALVTVAPALERLGDFAALLPLRKAESIGRPIGDADWIEALEARTGRTLAPAKRGPKTRSLGVKQTGTVIDRGRALPMNSRLYRLVSCPMWGSPLKGSLAKSLRRSYTTSCKSCGARLVSDVGWRWYLVMAIYTQVIALALILPLILGMVTGSWVTVGVVFLLFFALALPPAALLHARRIRPLVE